MTPVGPGLEERDVWAILASIPGLGPATFALLLAENHTALAILDLASTDAGLNRLRRGPPLAGGNNGSNSEVRAHPRRAIPDAVIDGLREAALRPDEHLGRLKSAGLSFVTLEDEGYPDCLRWIEEPPWVLFLRGELSALKSARTVAVVGTRRPTEHGRRIAARISDALARSGAIVVSGLAVGIDGAAHAAAVAAGRPTVAVLGSGHARLFPKAHRNLADAIAEGGGALISELPPDASPTAGTFPRRNRLISGLAEATVVVEAARRSGALITAGWALEQGRECFLVPGSPDAPASAGCLAFLRTFAGAARIVAGIPELLEDLELTPLTPAKITGGGWNGRPGSTLPPPGAAAVLASLGSVEADLAWQLIDGATTVDELVDKSGLTVATVLGALTLLEMRGLVMSVSGRLRPVGALASAEPGLPGQSAHATLLRDRRGRARLDQTATRSR